MSLVLLLFSVSFPAFLYSYFKFMCVEGSKIKLLNGNLFGYALAPFFISSIFCEISRVDKTCGIMKRLRLMNMYETAYCLSIFTILGIVSIFCAFSFYIVCLIESKNHLFINYLNYLLCSSSAILCLSVFSTSLLHTVMTRIFVVSWILTSEIYFKDKNWFSFGFQELKSPKTSLFSLYLFFGLFLLYCFLNQIFGEAKKSLSTIFISFFQCFQGEEKNTVIADNLSKRFGKSKVLKSASFKLKKGEITALLGTSGCGKSVVADILCGQIKQTSGKCLVFGYKPGSSAARDRTGVCPQETVLVPGLSALHHMLLFASVKGIDWFKQQQHCEEILNHVFKNYKDIKDHIVDGYSDGFKRALTICMSFIGSP